MARGSYKVRSITWLDEDTESFDAYDDEDAAELWCKQTASNGNFADGYPQGHELEVTAPTGVVTLVMVDTDFDPIYYPRSRGPR